MIGPPKQKFEKTCPKTTSKLGPKIGTQKGVLPFWVQFSGGKKLAKKQYFREGIGSIGRLV